VAMVTDGLSNTFMIAETVREVFNGQCPAWGYRAWVMAGIDPIQNQDPPGINDWWFNNKTQVYGTLGTWSCAGSLHPGGCNFAMGDGSVRFVSEDVPVPVLGHLSTIAEGIPASPD